MTSLVLLLRGVVLLASVVLLPSAESLPSLVLSPSVSELGVVITERAPSGVASLPRLALSPKRGVVVAKHAPRGAATERQRSGMTSLHERDALIIVAIIDNGATTKQCFVGVGSGSRGDLLVKGTSTSWEVMMSGQGY